MNILKKIFRGLKGEFFSYKGRMSRTQFIGGIFVLFLICGSVLLISGNLFSSLESQGNYFPDIFNTIF